MVDGKKGRRGRRVERRAEGSLLLLPFHHQSDSLPFIVNDTEGRETQTFTEKFRPELLRPTSVERKE